jgi:hypothetical protein
MTANKAQKSVSFGAHVVDNEGKRGNAGKSGIPNDCPGKFPSPWTPGTELKVDAGSDKKPRTKLTTALLDARTTPQLKPGHKAKARDDSDITMDLGAPRSESGRYWKEQYESYAEKSEKEVKRLVAKQQLAKDYAKKKDGEATELINKLEHERKRYRRRELELEQQNKDLQERLRRAMAETLSSSVEVAALKSRITTLEKSTALASSDVLGAKPSFQIYEDSSKSIIPASPEQEIAIEASYLSQRSRAPLTGKENSPPKPRHVRRQTLPDTSGLPTSRGATSRLGVEAGHVSTILAKSPRASTLGSESAANPIIAPLTNEQASKSSLRVRKTDLRKEDLPLKSPALGAPSSPLPIPSPGLEDPWVMNADESSIAPADRFALPIASGPSYSRPAAASRRLQRTSKTFSRVTKTDNPKQGQHNETRITNMTKPTILEPTTNSQEHNAYDEKSAVVMTSTNEEPVDVKSSSFDAAVSSFPDPKIDSTRETTHNVEGLSEAKRDKVQISTDRKEEARRRLLERKQKKQMAR